MSGYKFPIDHHGHSGAGDANEAISEVHLSAKPKSLIDICGFDTQPEKIGELRSFKKIHEAIVAVPFVVEEGERKFLKTMGPDHRNYDESAGPSLKRQARLMKKYVFPPALDYVENPDVEAAAMYIFEFSHKFDKDDLSHIWQNLPPRVGVRAESAMATVKHPMLSDELLGDKIPELEPEQADFPKELQWMVFKVKQRAKKDYFEQINKTQGATDASATSSYVGPPTSIPYYTHNWPYDFFSLVELAEIEAEVTFGAAPSRTKEDPPWTGPVGSDLDVYDAVPQDGSTLTGPQGATILTPDGDVDAEGFVNQTSDDVMGSLEGGVEDVKNAATGYTGGTVGTDAEGSALGGIGAGAAEVDTELG